MRHEFALIMLMSAQLGASQSGQPEILLVDPFMANGYFIVNEGVRQQLSATRIEIEVILNELGGNGTITETVLETLTIGPDEFYASGDPLLTGTLGPDESIAYHLTAYNDEDIEVLEACVGCDAWPLVCTLTCNAPAYAWALNTYSNGGSTIVELREGTSSGSWFYFYVRQSDWGQFTNQFTPDFWHMQGLNWGEAIDESSSRILNLTLPGTNIPLGARDYLGNLIGGPVSQGYGIFKSLGPWNGLVATAGPYTGGPGQYCVGDDYLQDVYNADALVQANMAWENMDPLVCQGFYTNDDTVQWGPSYSDSCTQFSLAYTMNDGSIDLIGWAVDVIECNSTASLGASLADLSSILFQHIQSGGATTVLGVSIDEIDPRLVPVPRTPIPAGLYQLILVMDDGSVQRRYVSFSAPVVLNSNFASFADIMIYPVPVVEQTFSIDFDLLVPLTINLNIVNNMGVHYHTKQLAYSQAGLNKYVVNMSGAWPLGLYHAIFTYPDGSMESRSFTVAE